MVKKSIGMLKEFLKEKKTVLYASFWYLVMIATLYGFGTLLMMLMPKNSYFASDLLQKSIAYIFLFIFISLAYVLAVVFIYSFFKTIIISTIQKKKISFNFLGGFFLFNVIAGILIAAIFSAIGFVMSYTFNGSQIANAIYFAVFIIFAYPFVNLSQLAFLKEMRIFRSMKLGIKTLLTQFGHYIRIILTDAVYVLMLLVLFLIVGSIYKAIFASQTSMIYITVYNTIFLVIASAVILAIAGYNLYFLNKIMHEKAIDRLF